MNSNLETLKSQQKTLQGILANIDQRLSSDSRQILRTLCEEAALVARNSHLSMWERSHWLSKLNKLRRYYEHNLSNLSKEGLETSKQVLLDELDILATEIESCHEE